MKAPYVEIYLSQEDGLCIARAKAPNVPFQLIVNVPLEDLRALDPADAAHRVGGTVLGLLQSWHGETLGDLNVLEVKAAERDESLYFAALKLVDMALSGKTAAHNASIEALLQEAAKESDDARKYLDDAWPVLRDRLTKIGG
ncbi:hypothetical protein [Ralstonia wenshanensis]|uniref:hypothetical protein n=1 Tax=Ralstonia wenshanensis TaxID=2842456 RepID=UPI0021B1C282|nr:hypothetical protein [Ralstonia wenshanensis]MCT7307908.1 hypothetical protein [Ralstonia wenshanensis]